jgi:tetratricopeptide (TPR) repeat protein
MKKLLSLGCLLCMFIFVHAQNSGSLSLSQLRSVYAKSLSISDFGTAISTMYQIMELDPNPANKDTLCLLYFNANMLTQATILGEEIAKANPDKLLIRQVLAISKQQLGMNVEALSEYEKIYASTHKAEDLYQIASLQYGLKRYGECISNLDRLIAEAENEKKKINVSVYQNQQQEVPISAACYNIKGVIALEVNQPEEAKKMFNKALDIFPDFFLPKRSLEMMAKQDKKDNAPKTTEKTSPGAAKPH